MDLATQAPVSNQRQQSEDDYEQFMKRLQARFDINTSSGEAPLFTTDASGLFDAYLASFAEADRQFHSCYACRRFVELAGGLVIIDPAGRTMPAVWDWEDAPEHYQPGIAAMAKLVRKANVTGVFLSSEKTWGLRSNADRKRGLTWHHFALTPSKPQIYNGLLKNAHQAAAEKREDHHTVARSLADFSAEHVEQALQLLRTEALYRSEKVIGPAEWMAAVHRARAAAQGSEARDNVLWKAVALAPAGFCHPRSSMIGTLLEDIAAGMAFAEVARRFKAKMHPLQYQRPQAPPTAGNIAQAEEAVAKLGITNALRRRFARVEEIEALWRPAATADEAAGSGVFGHLKPKSALAAAPMVTPSITMTWEKFARTVLPDATKLELLVPAARANFGAYLTAADADAPPILQWDALERRNPFSLYVYTGCSPAQQWGLVPATWCAVTAVSLSPSMWHGADFKHHSRSVMFVLDGARDSRKAGLALFPETLRSELHGVRATIEAYSMRGEIEGAAEASACGLILSAGGKADDVPVRVTSGKQMQHYRLDRWD